jgi:nucleoid-associated protein YgaU
MTFVNELDKSGFIDRLYKSPPVVAGRAAPSPTPTATKEKGVEDERIKMAKTSPPLEAKPKNEPAQVPGKMTPHSPAPTPAKTTAAQEYTIKAGDTLMKLAEQHYGSPAKWEKIYAANKDVIKNPNYIFVGEKIILPPADSASGT